MKDVYRQKRMGQGDETRKELFVSGKVAFP